MIEWKPAQLIDVDAMMALTGRYYLSELNGVLTADLDKLAETVSHYIISRNFNPGTALVQTAWQDGNLIAWHWLGRGGSTDYIREEIAEAHILHLDLALSSLTKVRLVNEILDQWIKWCQILEIPVLCSTTVREDWQGFMRLHQRRGFTVHGSHAFMKINKDLT